VSSGETEFNNNVFYITTELYDRKKSDFISEYINPVLNFSFNFHDKEKIQEKKHLNSRLE